MIGLFEDREPPPRILPHRFDQRQVGAAGGAALQLDPVRCTRASSARRARGRCRTGRRAAARARRRRAWRSDRDRAAATAGSPYGASTISKVAGSERQRADVAADEPQARRPRRRRASRERRHAAPRAREHRRGSVDADERTPARASGSEMRPVPQPSSSTGPRACSGDVAPERHVAPAERPGVLPVVERRVRRPSPVQPSRFAMRKLSVLCGRAFPGAGGSVGTGESAASLSPPAGPAPNPASMQALPPLVLWAWERPADLRNLPPATGVALLTQTLRIDHDRVVTFPRRQPLRVDPATPLVASTHRGNCGAHLNRRRAAGTAGQQDCGNRDAAASRRSPGRFRCHGVTARFLPAAAAGAAAGVAGTGPRVDHRALASWCAANDGSHRSRSTGSADAVPDG